MHTIYYNMMTDTTIANEGVVTPTPPNIKNTFFDGNDKGEIYVKIKSAGDNNISIEELGDNCSNLYKPTVFLQNKLSNTQPINTNLHGGKKQKSKHSKQTKKSNKSRKAKKSKQSRKVHRK